MIGPLNPPDTQPGLHAADRSAIDAGERAPPGTRLLQGQG